MNILDNLNEVFQELGISAEPVTPETNIRDLEMDSLDMLDMIIEVEDKFDITISDRELLPLETIRELMDLISNKINV